VTSSGVGRETFGLPAALDFLASVRGPTESAEHLAPARVDDPNRRRACAPLLTDMTDMTERSPYQQTLAANRRESQAKAKEEREREREMTSVLCGKE